MKKPTDLAAWLTIGTTVVGAAIAFLQMQPNNGSVRFQDDVITVNAEAAVAWGADPSALAQWGIPFELVSGEADVTVTVGSTRCQFVEGYGEACAAGTATPVVNSKRWMTSCDIVLSEKSTFDKREATTVLVHEFGHCLGMKHDDTKDSIMGTALPSDAYTPEFWSYFVTPADREMAQARYGL